MMSGKSNAQQSEPQLAGLNVYVNLSAIRHAHHSFTVWACAASISRQSALIVWHNACVLVSVQSLCVHACKATIIRVQEYGLHQHNH